MHRRTPALLVLVSVASLAAGACSSGGDGDPPAPAPATAVGDGVRIKDVVDPAKKMAGAFVNITGATVVWVDTFDETRDGKSKGTIYVQDVGSNDKYSGTSLFGPTFVPSNLRVAPGDVVDLNGQYTESANIGKAIFTPPQVLPQIAKPTSTFRFEYKLPDPVVIDVNDLNDYAKGRPWMNMLVTVKDVTVGTAPSDSDPPTGRVTAPITADITNRNGATMSNELTDIAPNSLPAGTKLKSLTGLVTWFFSYHIAPRSQADIVAE